MPSSENLFAGVCVRIRDGAAFFEVKAQLDGPVLRDLGESSHRLFPPAGEVEWRSAEIRSYAVGDWAAFDAIPQGAPGQRKPLKAVDVRPLIPIEDYSQLGSVEAARRLLVQDGLPSRRAGEIACRIGERELVRIRFAQDDDGFWRACERDALARLPVYRFDEDLCVRLGPASHPTLLFDPKASPDPIGYLNWSPDADLIRRIVKQLHRTDQSNDEALRRFAEALNKYADNLETRAASHTEINTLAAWDVLRLRKLSETIRDEQDVLAAYFEQLRSSPELKSYIETRISEIASERAESDRARLAAEMTTALNAEFAARRAEQEAELKRSIDDLTSEMTSNLEAAASKRKQEVETELAELEYQGLEDVDRSLGEKRQQLTSEVSALEARQSDLSRHLAQLEDSKTELSRSLSDLKTKEQEALTVIERLSQAATTLQARNNAQDQETVIPSGLCARPEATKLRVPDVKRTISASPLLSAKGKDLLLRFCATMLAREVPIVLGPECDEFLAIAEHLLFGGRRRSLQADPTIITFEDLWVRPGTRAPTALKIAVSDARDSKTAELAVILQADQSGARFWYPALVDRVKRGELPANCFFCATLRDPDSEEAQCVLGGAMTFEASGITAPKAGLIAPALIDGREANRTLLDLEQPVDVEPSNAAIQWIATCGLSLDLNAGRRAARVFEAASLIAEHREAELIAREAAHCIAGRAETPNLNIVAGGAGRA